MVASRAEAALDSEERLRRLVQAGIRISAEHSPDAVVQAVVDSARHVLDARYAALGVFDPATAELKRFVTSGLDPERAALIGAGPRGRGVLGLLLTESRPIRLADLRQHPGAHGFPPHHPEMTSFLGVPITGRKGVIGNLYLTEKIGAPEFTAGDEAIAVLLAAQAAVALENAELHDESARLVREVRTIQASRDRFFAMINHELRNALTAVYGWADLLLRKMGAEPPRAAREVYESSERTLALLNDLLELSRIEAARLRPSLRDADAARLVADAVASLEPVAAKRSIRLVTAGATHPVPCVTDPQRVRQILINLLSNAVRHSPSEEAVTVSLMADDARLRFEVADKGPGIPQSEMARIFEAFARGGSTDERGTGLGLTLSRQLAVLLGGDLKVASQPGAGATFVLDLPRGGKPPVS
jgi:signal transduction histidine kinase